MCETVCECTCVLALKRRQVWGACVTNDFACVGSNRTVHPAVGVSVRVRSPSLPSMEEAFARLSLQTTTAESEVSHPLTVALAKAALRRGDLDDRFPCILIFVYTLDAHGRTVALQDDVDIRVIAYARQQFWLKNKTDNTFYGSGGLLTQLTSLYQKNATPGAVVFRCGLRLPGYSLLYNPFHLRGGITAAHKQRRQDSKKSGREAIVHADLGLLVGLCDWVLREVTPEVAQTMRRVLRDSGDLPETLTDTIVEYMGYPPVREPHTGGSDVTHSGPLVSWG
jgi:hypothetical protein